MQTILPSYEFCCSKTIIMFCSSIMKKKKLMKIHQVLNTPIDYLGEGVKIQLWQIVQNQINKVVILQALWLYLLCSGGDSETGPRDLAGTWHHPLYFPEDHCVGSQEWVFPVKENFLQFLLFDQQIWTWPTWVFYAVSNVCIITIDTQICSVQKSLVLLNLAFIRCITLLNKQWYKFDYLSDHSRQQLLLETIKSDCEVDDVDLDVNCRQVVRIGHWCCHEQPTESTQL